jgi:peroxiredoxin
MTLTQKIVGSYAPDFELPGIDGEVYHLGRYREKFKAIAVIFLKNQAPQVIKYIECLKQIQAQFAKQKFTIVAINSNDPDNSQKESFADMKAFATNHELNFPYLRDTTQDVAKSFGAKFIPEVFLLDSNAVICYTGQIDRNNDSPETVQNHYLQDNISKLLSK